MIKNGAKVNKKREDGETALHLATRRENQVIIQLLTENGANVEERDHNGNSPLHWALRIGVKDIVEL
jgi:ankyrin repeat protein